MAADKIGHPTDQQARVIGASVTRLEDAPLVRGEGLFAADVSFPRQLHMRVVRSPLAHGRIVAIDVSMALSSPGVVAAWTNADIADLPPIDFRDDRVEPLIPYRQPLLAREQVRYVGEPVAVVFTEDAYAAEDAAEQVTINIESSAAVTAADSSHAIEPMIIEKAYGDIDEA